MSELENLAKFLTQALTLQTGKEWRYRDDTESRYYKRYRLENGSIYFTLTADKHRGHYYWMTHAPANDYHTGERLLNGPTLPGTTKTLQRKSFEEVLKTVAPQIPLLEKAYLQAIVAHQEFLQKEKTREAVEDDLMRLLGNEDKPRYRQNEFGKENQISGQFTVQRDTPDSPKVTLRLHGLTPLEAQSILTTLKTNGRI